MNDNFNEQKDVLLAIKREINLLQQQVDFLIRNEKTLGLLDLDVMMNRTHTMYDLMCGVEVGELEGREGREGLEEREELEELEEREELEELEEMEEENEEMKEEEIPEENDTYFIEEAEEEGDETPVEEPKEEAEEETKEGVEEETKEETGEETKTEGADDLGFILNFELVEETENEETENGTPKGSPTEWEVKRRTENVGTVFTTGDEIEMTIPQAIMEEQMGVTMEEQTGVTMEEQTEVTMEEQTGVTMEEQTEVTMEEQTEVTEEDIVYEPVVIGDMTDHDDGGFELEQPETVGERYQQGQEETVGERLQHGSVRNLQGTIGINDKFLFVNELFGGSMEKYNRSIENLDDLKTLNGALIYLNELRIELQWNSNNEAYKKLLELVHRKFEN